jgi:hypothetical protein
MSYYDFFYRSGHYEPSLKLNLLLGIPATTDSKKKKNKPGEAIPHATYALGAKQKENSHAGASKQRKKNRASCSRSLDATHDHQAALFKLQKASAPPCPPEPSYPSPTRITFHCEGSSHFKHIMKWP